MYGFVRWAESGAGLCPRPSPRHRRCLLTATVRVHSAEHAALLHSGITGQQDILGKQFRQRLLPLVKSYKARQADQSEEGVSVPSAQISRGRPIPAGAVAC